MTARRRNYRRKKNINLDNYQPPFSQKVLKEPITILNFSRKNTLELLKRANIATLYDVLIREEKDFYRIHTFNKKNLIDVKKAVQERNLHLKPTSREKQGQKNTARKPRRQPKPKEPVDKYRKINRGGKWGFVMGRNKVVVQPQYDEVYSFQEDLCCVEKNGKFGFIDRQGDEVVPIIYECALSFSQGLACVYKNNKCGYINKDNEVVVDFLFDAATPVENGNCRVKKDGKWGEMWIEDMDNIRWIN